VVIKRAAMAASTKPIASPASVNAMPRLPKENNISLEVAPNAMRTPISLVRWVTAQESTPYNPSDASNSASSANALKSVVLCIGVDNWRSTISSRV